MQWWEIPNRNSGDPRLKDCILIVSWGNKLYVLCAGSYPFVGICTLFLFLVYRVRPYHNICGQPVTPELNDSRVFQILPWYETHEGDKSEPGHCNSTSSDRPARTMAGLFSRPFRWHSVEYVSKYCMSVQFNSIQCLYILYLFTNHRLIRICIISTLCQQYVSKYVHKIIWNSEREIQYR